jgi:hypothetical protein
MLSLSHRISAGNAVDVRDLAHAHVKAITVEEAGNNRFAISKQPYAWQDALDIANSVEAIKEAFPKLPVGKPGSGAEIKQNCKSGEVSLSLSKRALTMLC